MNGDCGHKNVQKIRHFMAQKIASYEMTDTFCRWICQFVDMIVGEAACMHNLVPKLNKV